MPVPPARNEAYNFEVALVSQADTNIFQTTPTLAAGDVQVSIDGGAFANITALPTEIGATGVLTVAMTAAEMNGDRIAVRFHDAAGAEWQDLLVTIETGDIPAEVWAESVRTLTSSAAAVAASVAGDHLAIHRGDSWSQSITGLGDISTRTLLWFTIKRDRGDADSGAIVQVLVTNPAAAGDGLQILNGATATAAQGSITVDDAAAGDITIVLDEVATAQLADQACVYDVQVLTAAGAVSTLTDGNLEINADVTRATS